MDDSEESEIDFDSLPITSITARREGGRWSVTMWTSWQRVTITHDGDFGDALERAAQRIYDGESDDTALESVN